MSYTLHNENIYGPISAQFKHQPTNLNLRSNQQTPCPLVLRRTSHDRHKDAYYEWWADRGVSNPKQPGVKETYAANVLQKAWKKKCEYIIQKNHSQKLKESFLQLSIGDCNHNFYLPLDVTQKICKYIPKYIKPIN